MGWGENLASTYNTPLAAASSQNSRDKRLIAESYYETTYNDHFEKSNRTLMQIELDDCAKLSLNF